MEKWFDDRFEREDYRKYTKKRLSNNSSRNFLKRLSVSNWLIVLNIIVFIIILILNAIFKEENVLNYVALQPFGFFQLKIWTVFTSMFIHAGFFHLFVNMFSLFFLGNFVEKIIGRKRFFWLYIISGIAAGVFFASLSQFLGNCSISLYGICIGKKIFSDPMIFAVGASGAIFALAGLLAVLTPKNKVYLIVGPLIAIILQAILSSAIKSDAFLSTFNLIVNVYIIFSIFAMFSFNPSIRRLSLPLEMPFWILPIVAIVPLVIVGLFIDLPIGNMAHLGGLLCGMFYGFYLRKKYRQKTMMISKMFSK